MGALTSLSPLPLQCIAETPTDTPPGSRRLASSSQASGAPPLDEVTVGPTRSFRLGGFGPEPFFLCDWLLPCASAGADIANASRTQGTIDRRARKARKGAAVAPACARRGATPIAVRGRGSLAVRRVLPSLWPVRSLVLPLRSVRALRSIRPVIA